MGGGVAGGLVPGHRQQDHEPGEFLRTQCLTVDIGIEQRRDDIVGRALALLLGEVPRVPHDLSVGHLVAVGEFGVVVAHHLVRPLEELATIGLRHTEQFGDRLQRQLACDLLDEIAAAGLLGLVHDALGTLAQRDPQAFHRARGETTGDDTAQLVMLRRVGVDQHGALDVDLLAGDLTVEADDRGVLVGGVDLGVLRDLLDVVEAADDPVAAVVETADSVGLVHPPHGGARRSSANSSVGTRLA